MRTRRIFSFYLMIGALCSGLFLLSSAHYFRIGYPLDDAWIHQTFARNLVEHGEWAMNPGEATAGSTSPLWTLLLSVGYLLHIPQIIWTDAWGIFFLVLSGTLAFLWIQSETHYRGWLPLIGGLLVVSEWHLVWASVAGMEITMLCAISLAVFFMLSQDQPAWPWVGLLCGLAVWVRPDGLTLLGPVLVVWAIHVAKHSEGRYRQTGLFPFLVLLLAGFGMMNQALSGSFWPNTFSAKQTEYAALQQSSLFLRFLKIGSAPLTGVGMVLLPGFIYFTWQAVKQKNWLHLSILAWILGYLWIYAWKLPVSYQHGRYEMPIIPAYLVVSVLAWKDVLLPEKPERWQFVFSRAYLGLGIVTPAIFLALGAQAYQKDVAIIETEMVDTARWISAETPSNAVVAAHDIGALGYFGNRKILDLAGLINPEVIPYLGNSGQISAYIQQVQPDYLEIFPGWYQPPLELQMMQMYSSGAAFSPAIGGENMGVYKLQWK